MTPQYFFYRDNGGLRKVKVANIQFLQAKDNHTRIHEAGGFREVRVPLKTALEQLRNDSFVQVHRSFVVAIDKIELITKEFIILEFDPKLQIPLSEKLIPNLLIKLEILGTALKLKGDFASEEELIPLNPEPDSLSGTGQISPGLQSQQSDNQ